MSTALGHGLVDPKRRGKPVSFANKGGRVSGLMGALGFFSFFLLTGEGTLLRSLLPVEGERGGCSILSEGWRVLGHTPSAVSKGNPAKIPEPEGWTERRWGAESETSLLLVAGLNA